MERVYPNMCKRVLNMTKPLSPATQAIIDASNCAGSRCVQLHIADALRALAVRINGANAIRQDVLDIAAELEAQ